MRTLTIQDTRAHLGALLRDVESQGEKIIICRQGKPVADLVPHPGSRIKTSEPPAQHHNYIRQTDPVALEDWI